MPVEECALPARHTFVATLEQSLCVVVFLILAGLKMSVEAHRKFADWPDKPPFLPIFWPLGWRKLNPGDVVRFL